MEFKIDPECAGRELDSFLCSYQWAMLDRTLVPLSQYGVHLRRHHFNFTKFMAPPDADAPLFCGAVRKGDTLTLAQPPRPTKHIAGRAVLVGSTDNFGHYTLNHLPRLTAALDFGLDVEHYVVGSTPPYVFGMFDALGVDREKILSITGDDIVSFDQIALLPMLCHVGNHRGALDISSDYPEKMRSRLCRLSPRPQRRLYLPRKAARWRRLLNEDEVIAALTPLGFEVYDPAGRPMAEQLATIGAAERVIGPGGAAMALCSFAPDGVQIIELRHQGSVYYGEWCDALIQLAGGIHYKFNGSAAPRPDQRLIDADFTIDAAALAHFVLRPTTPGQRIRRSALGRVKGARRADMLFLRAPTWTSLVGGSENASAIRVKNALIDRALVPMFGDCAAVDRVIADPAAWWSRLESPLFRGAAVPQGQVILAGPTPPTKKITGPVALVGSCDDPSEFLLHHAPRLILARALGHEIRAYIVGPNPHFVSEAFARVGLDPRRILPVTGEEVVWAEDATLLPMACSLGEERRWAVDRELFALTRATLAPPAPRRGGRLLLGATASSGLALWRERLSGLGVAAMAVDQTSLTALLTAVAAADWVVLADDAVLPAALYAPAETVVSRLAPGDPPLWWPPLAKHLQLRWRPGEGRLALDPAQFLSWVGRRR